ncbi:hypothetical protein KC19_12G082300 [Ceratodon purpureus]|uniref:Uncharacterized protein n=1 Tax=Ceratodon purpureus TaxID=3225 RepID=A0A8T0GAL9_CERPU|nr:hypothetical protein KC19_12G082300 [Ceratodon purpureus]
MYHRLPLRATTLELNLLLGCDSILHTLNCISQCVACLLQQTGTAILGLHSLVRGHLGSIRGCLLRLLPLLTSHTSSLVGLVASCSRNLVGLVLRRTGCVRSTLLRLLPLLPGHIACLVCLVSSYSCCFVSLLLRSAGRILQVGNSFSTPQSSTNFTQFQPNHTSPYIELHPPGQSPTQMHRSPTLCYIQLNINFTDCIATLCITLIKPAKSDVEDIDRAETNLGGLLGLARLLLAELLGLLGLVGGGVLVAVVRCHLWNWKLSYFE